jgi:multiple sugar transport system substrate-binding protein
MKKAKLPVDAATIPTLYGTPASYADSHSFVLPRQLVVDEEKRKDAYKFVSDILKGSLLWAEAGHIPAYQPVVQSQAYRDLTPQVHYANAADIIAYDPEAWFSGSGSDWQNYFAEYIQNVLLGRSKAKDGWDGFVARTNDLLSRPNPV